MRSKSLIAIVAGMPTFLVVVGMMAFTIYMFYPGVINADSSYQLLQAHLFKFTDWHPPMMSFLWFWLNHIHDGVPVMLIFHNLVFWSGLFLLAFWIAPKTNFFRILFLIFFGLFPTVLAQLGMVFKDTAMSVSLFFASVLLLYASGVTTKTKRIVLLIVSVIFLFYGFSVRLNSFPAVIVMCIWLGEIITDKKFFKGLLVGLGLFVVLVITNQLIIGKILHPLKTYPLQQVQVHDLAAISLAEKKPIFPEYILSGPNFNLDKLQLRYTPANVGELLFYHDGVIRLTSNRADITKLSTIWWQSIFEHPIDYLWHRTQVFSCLLSGCMPFWDDVCRPTLVSVSYVPEFIYDLYCRLTVNGPLKFLFHSWVYIINSVVIGAVAIYSRRKLTDFRAIMYLVVSGLLYVMGSFFVAPACEFRYIYWGIIASLFALSLLVKDIFMMKAELDQ